MSGKSLKERYRAFREEDASKRLLDEQRMKNFDYNKGFGQSSFEKRLGEDPRSLQRRLMGEEISTRSIDCQGLDLFNQIAGVSEEVTLAEYYEKAVIIIPKPELDPFSDCL